MDDRRQDEHPDLPGQREEHERRSRHQGAGHDHRLPSQPVDHRAGGAPVRVRKMLIERRLTRRKSGRARSDSTPLRALWASPFARWPARVGVSDAPRLTWTVSGMRPNDHSIARPARPATRKKGAERPNPSATNPPTAGPAETPANRLPW